MSATKRILTPEIEEHARKLLAFEPAERALRREVAEYGRAKGADYFYRLARDEPEKFTPDVIFWAIRLGDMKLAPERDGRVANAARARTFIHRESDDLYDI